LDRSITSQARTPDSSISEDGTRRHLHWSPRHGVRRGAAHFALPCWRARPARIAVIARRQLRARLEVTPTPGATDPIAAKPRR
jgi:hypothetical protein